jgi:hypothetical protein
MKSPDIDKSSHWRSKSQWSAAAQQLLIILTFDRILGPPLIPPPQIQDLYQKDDRFRFSPPPLVVIMGAADPTSSWDNSALGRKYIPGKGRMQSI